MASSIDIRASLVQRSVDDEASRIDRLVRPVDTFSFVIDVHHVGDLEQAKVHAIRVDPKGIWPHRIPQANVPAAAVGEPELGKDAERTGHLLELPSPRGFFGLWEGNVVQSLDLPAFVLGGIVQSAEVGRHRLRLSCHCRCSGHDVATNGKKTRDDLERISRDKRAKEIKRELYLR